MKKINHYLLGIIFITLSIVTTGCKKDKDKTDPTNNTTTGKPNDRQASSEADQAIDDVNSFINNKVGGGSNQRVSAYNLPCGVVSVDSTSIGGGKYSYSMHYGSQNSCGYNNYKKKSGTLTFALTNSSNAFKDVGSVFTLTFIDYVVEDTYTNVQYKLNGTLKIMNVNGGYIWEAVTASSTIAYKVRGKFTVTYSDGTARDRSYFQTRTWASTGGWAGLSQTIAGDTTIGTTSVCELGKTYDGNYDYQVQLLTALKWSNCGSTWAGPYVLKQGHGRFDLTVPLVSPTYIDVEAGYKWDYTNASSTPSQVGDCTTNAYKITTVLGPVTTSVYQLY